MTIKNTFDVNETVEGLDELKKEILLLKDELKLAREKIAMYE